MYNDTGGNDLDELCWEALPNVAVNASNSCESPPTGPGISSYTYDSYGNVLSSTDFQGNGESGANFAADTTRYGYYNNGLECWTAPPTVTAAGSTCSNAGSSPTGAPVGATIFEYDNQSDVTTTTVGYQTSVAATTTSTYDVDGELLYSIPPDGQGDGGFGSNPYETSYTYLLEQEIATADSPDGYSTTYTYDPAAKQTSEADPGGVTTTTYDKDGRVCWSQRTSSTLTNPTCGTVPSGATSYTYLAGTSAPATMRNADGNTWTYTYSDAFYPTDATAVTDPMSDQVTYTAYDELGNACVTGPVNEGAESCGSFPGDTYNDYDAEGQLLYSEDPGPGGSQPGNVTQYQYGDTAYPTSPTSVTNPDGDTTTYSYDYDGRVTETTDAIGNHSYTGYDADSRVCWTGASAPASQSTPCTPMAGQGVTQYNYDSDSRIATRVDNYGESNTKTATYSYDSSGNLLSLSDDNGNTVGYQYNDANLVSCIAYPVHSGDTCSSPPGSTNTVVDRSYNSADQLGIP